MKKFFALAFAMLMWVSSLGSVMASGCFHDAIHVVSKAWVISRWANVRNVACMYGSTKIATLAQGTKVRIIWQTAWTKIVMPDGNIWRVWNNFVNETSDWSNVPAFPSNHNVNDYCSTINLTRCPNPSPQWVEPTWYYRTVPNYTSPTPPPVVTPPAPTPPAPTPATLSDAAKTKLDAMVTNLLAKVDARYSSPTHKIIFLSNIVTVLETIKQQHASIAMYVDYIKVKLEETISMLELEKLLNI